MSLQAYCLRSYVPYEMFGKWIRGIYKRVVPVQVTGYSEELKIENLQLTGIEQQKKTGNENVSICTSSCIGLAKDGLDCISFGLLIKELESLLC